MIALLEKKQVFPLRGERSRDKDQGQHLLSSLFPSLPSISRLGKCAAGGGGGVISLHRCGFVGLCVNSVKRKVGGRGGGLRGSVWLHLARMRVG